MNTKKDKNTTNYTKITKNNKDPTKPQVHLKPLQRDLKWLPKKKKWMQYWGDHGAVCKAVCSSLIPGHMSKWCPWTRH